MRPFFYIILSNSAIFDAPNCSISRGRKRGKSCDSYTEFGITSESNEEHGSIKVVTRLTLFGELTENAGKEELLLLLRMAGDNISITFTGLVQETSPAGIQEVLKVQLLDDDFED